MKKISLLLLTATCSLAIMAANDFEIDLREAPLGYGDSFSAKYLVVGTPYSYLTETYKPSIYDAYFEANRFNESAPKNSAHGYVNLVVTVPVVAGNYKVTLGSCQYGTGTGTVKNAAKTVLANFDQKLAGCYHEDPTTNKVSATFSVASVDTIKITCGNYTPYIKFETLVAEEYTISFVNETEGSIGTVPASASVIAGKSLIIPNNHTLYKEGYTLTGWSDGVNTHAIGTSYTPEASATLTAVFTENASDFLSATSEFTVRWDFMPKNGAPNISVQSSATQKTAFLVAQGTIGVGKVDIKLDIDATNGKFQNTSNADWCQVNQNTKFDFPSKQNAIVRTYTMAEPTGSTVDEAAYGSYENYITTYTINSTSGSSELVTGSGSIWYTWLEVTYPASASNPTALDNINATVQTVKRIVNGQLLIERDGKTYTMQGQLIK